jgi:hypothetical protein
VLFFGKTLVRCRPNLQTLVGYSADGCLPTNGSSSRKNYNAVEPPSTENKRPKERAPSPAARHFFFCTTVSYKKTTNVVVLHARWQGGPFDAPANESGGLVGLLFCASTCRVGGRRARVGPLGPSQEPSAPVSARVPSSAHGSTALTLSLFLWADAHIIRKDIVCNAFKG